MALRAARSAIVISSHSRAQAFRDGVLIDVSETAREAGFRYPVVLTRAAWEKSVAVPPGMVCQDEAGPALGRAAHAGLRGSSGTYGH
jgi:hypothetical protein